MHRIGRTARAGRSGQSLIFLTEKETSYVDFLKARKVDLEHHETEKAEDYAELSKMVQDSMLKDKDLVDKSQDAFVSYIRYYKEH